MFEIIVFIIVFSITYVGVGIFRRWSLRREIFDIPNERSSHTIPTPRGGGIIIVLTVLVAYLILSLFGRVYFDKGFFIGSLLIALISWRDDLFSVSFVWRFLIHTVAAILFILFSGYFEIIAIPFGENTYTNIFGMIFTYLWIVWLTNAYNFMDGIDGIAGIQAVVAGIGWFLVGSLNGMPESALIGGLLAAASMGFLIHNWQPAKIFMGDVGSAFLGFSFAVVPLLKTKENNGLKEFLPYLAVMLVWLFLFDTVYTFLRRLLKKQKVWEAHREHLYQQLVIAGFSHRFVTILYGLIALLNSSVVFVLSITNNLKPLFIIGFLALEAVVLAFWVSRIKKIA